LIPRYPRGFRNDVFFSPDKTRRDAPPPFTYEQKFLFNTKIGFPARTPLWRSLRSTVSYTGKATFPSSESFERTPFLFELSVVPVTLFFGTCAFFKYLPLSPPPFFFPHHRQPLHFRDRNLRGPHPARLAEAFPLCWAFSCIRVVQFWLKRTGFSLFVLPLGGPRDPGARHRPPCPGLRSQSCFFFPPRGRKTPQPPDKAFLPIRMFLLFSGHFFLPLFIDFDPSGFSEWKWDAPPLFFRRRFAVPRRIPLSLSFYSPILPHPDIRQLLLPGSDSCLSLIMAARVEGSFLFQRLFPQCPPVTPPPVEISRVAGL